MLGTILVISFQWKERQYVLGKFSPKFDDDDSDGWATPQNPDWYDQIFLPKPEMGGLRLAI